MKDRIVHFAVLAVVSCSAGCGRGTKPTTAAADEPPPPVVEPAAAPVPPTGFAGKDAGEPEAEKPSSSGPVQSPEEVRLFPENARVAIQEAGSGSPTSPDGTDGEYVDGEDANGGDVEEREDDPEVDSGNLGSFSSLSLGETSEAKVGVMKALSRFRSGVDASASVPAELSGLWGDAGGSDGEDANGDGKDAENDPEEDAFCKTVNLVTAALDDGDPAVRDAAFETMARLPEPEWQALSLQVMSGEDDELKMRLIDFAKEGRDAYAVTLLMQGLDSDSPDVRTAAGDGLSSLFGLQFESTDDAMDWWEENFSNYEFGEDGMSLVAPKENDENEDGPSFVGPGNDNDGEETP